MIFNYKNEKNGSINVFTLSGELIDKNQASAMMNEIQELIVRNENRFILDLSELKYINSSGLSLLINILTKARKSGGDVSVTNVTKKVNELLVITKLNSVFNVTDSMEKAIEKLS